MDDFQRLHQTCSRVGISPDLFISRVHKNCQEQLPDSINFTKQDQDTEEQRVEIWNVGGQTVVEQKIDDSILGGLIIDEQKTEEQIAEEIKIEKQIIEDSGVGERNFEESNVVRQDAVDKQDVVERHDDVERQDTVEKQNVVERNADDQDEKENKLVKENKLEKENKIEDENKLEEKSVPKSRRKRTRRSTVRFTSHKSYNLRKKRKIDLSPIPYCHKDGFLKQIDINLYHAHTPLSKVARKVLDLCKINLRSQLDCFALNQSNLYVKTWITTTRIFEYNVKDKTYTEVKRFPKRYVEVAPNLITSIHYCDENLYVGYIANDNCPDQKVSYLEIRDTNGSLQSKPYYYEQVIKTIESREDFVYVLTVKNDIHIHHKRNFHFRAFHIDMKSITSDRLINITAKGLHHSKLQLTTSTSRSIIISHYNAINHTILQSFNFDDTDAPGYVTVSTHFSEENLIIVRRMLVNSVENNQAKCRLVFGHLTKTLQSPKKCDYFIQEATICLEYNVLQTELVCDDKLYILGSTIDQENVNRYELGCINIRDFQPIWVMPLPEADNDSRILVHTDHIIVVRNCQKDYCISFESLQKRTSKCVTCHIELPNQRLNDHEYHPGLLSNLKILRNKSLFDIA